ncbi:MAG: hypothetical protein FWD53_04545 [Phycisphaerales bacterium]|nr:hypothetical protein [Phycisphaerales bacterium]
MPTAPPIPSPIQTLKRTLLRVAIAFAILAICWTIWYAHAAHALNSRLADYRNRNEPTILADFVPPLPSGTVTAYDHLCAATTEMNSLTTDERELIYGSKRSYHPLPLPFSKADAATAQAMLDRLTTVPISLEKARNAPTIVTANQFVHITTLTRYQHVAALYHHQNQRDDLAFASAQSITTIANIVAHDSSLDARFLSTIVHAVATMTWLRLAPNLTIQSPTPPILPHGIPREQLLTLIRELLDDTTLHQGLLRTIRCKRVNLLNTLDKCDRGIILSPSFRLDTARIMNYYDALLLAIGPPPTTSATHPPLAPRPPLPPVYDRGSSNLREYARPFSRDIYLEQPIRHHHHTLTDRHATALRLAIRLYQLDHDDQIPPDLATLIPTYLPTLPIDTFHPDGNPLTYLPAKRLFYSVGTNHLDDGGNSTTLNNPAWDGLDIVYPLDPN